MTNLMFRAWYKEREEYWTVGALNMFTRQACIGPPFDNEWVSFDAVIIEQYTGLDTYYGEPIYEGDVGYDGHFECWGKVVYEDGGFRYKWAGICDDLAEHHASDDISWYQSYGR